MLFKEAWWASFAPDWRAREHLHPDTWEIILVTQGSVEINLEGRRLNGAAGSVFLYRPSTPHWERTTSQTELKMMGFYWKAKDPRLVLPDRLHDSSGRIGQALRWICDLRCGYGPKFPVLDSLANAVVFECRRAVEIPGDVRMERVKSFIADAGSEAITVKRLAEIACMSERHFAREFQRRTMTTPMTYVRKVRLEKASIAIAQSDVPLREIAHSLGFRDEFEFSRVFRRVMGYAPSTLRHPQQKSKAAR